MQKEAARNVVFHVNSVLGGTRSAVDMDRRCIVPL